MAIDYYADAEIIALLLAEQGFEDTATQLREVILSGSTETEILMGLRYICVEFLQSRTSGSEALRAKLHALIGAINNAIS